MYFITIKKIERKERPWRSGKTTNEKNIKEQLKDTKDRFF